MRLGNVVEGEDAPAEAEEEDRAKRDEGPEGKLSRKSAACLQDTLDLSKGTYHGDNLLLD